MISIKCVLNQNSKEQYDDYCADLIQRFGWLRVSHIICLSHWLQKQHPDCGDVTGMNFVGKTITLVINVPDGVAVDQLTSFLATLCETTEIKQPDTSRFPCW